MTLCQDKQDLYLVSTRVLPGQVYLSSETTRTSDIYESHSQHWLLWSIINLDPDHYLPGYHRRRDTVCLNSDWGSFRVINLWRCQPPITIYTQLSPGSNGGLGPIYLRWDGDMDLHVATVEATGFLGIISPLVSQYWVPLGWTGFYWEPRSIFLEVEVTHTT